MKPLGTITKYYPFVDDETRILLESTMKQAYNYQNFINSLTERALDDDSSKTIVFLAYLHAFKIWAFDDMEALSIRYASDPMIRPFHMWMRAYEGVETDWKETQKAIKYVLSMKIDDWIAAEMHLLILLAYGLQPHWGLHENKSLDALISLVAKNSSLESYSSSILYYQSVLASNEAEQSLAYLNNSLEVARKFDDRLSVADISISIASQYLENMSDTKLATALLEETGRIYDDLGSNYGTAIVQQCMGLIARHRGEFNLAIELYEQSMSYFEKVSHPHEFIVLALAASYYEIGDLEATKDLALMGLETVSHIPTFFIRSHLYLARVKADSRLLKEATFHLGEAKKKIHKKGSERLLASYQECSGILERAEGDLVSALQTFADSYKISQQIGDRHLMNIALLRLAETEVMQYQLDDTNQSQNSSGMWLDELYSITSENDFPGLYGRALLLRAELRYKQNRNDDAVEILSEVRELAEKPGLAYLADMASELKHRADIISYP